MSSKLLLAAGGVLALAGAGMFMVLSTGEAARPSDLDDSISRDASIPRTSPSAGDAPDLTSVASAEGGRAEARIEGAGASAAMAIGSGGDSNIDDAHRITVQVDVRVPMGAPADPDLVVVAWSDEELEDGEFDWSSERMRRRMSRRGSADQALESFAVAEDNDEVRWSVTESATDGVYDVTFDDRAKLGRVLLSGRYLYLASPLEVDLAGGTRRVVAEPKVGTWITGRIDAGGAQLAALEDGTYGTVRFQGGTMGSGRSRMGFVDRSAPIDETLSFEFRGARSDIVAELMADVPAWAAEKTPVGDMTPGGTMRPVVRLSAGGAIEGRVVDLDGQPVAGAAVEAKVRGRGMMGRGRGVERKATSDTDGAFRIAGITAGDHNVTATLEGWRPGSAGDSIEVQNGSTRTAVLVTMDPGFVVEGRVLLPDGSGASGATLKLEQAAPNAGGERRGGWGRGGNQKERKETTAAADGSFEFLALAESTARIAVASGELDAGATFAAVFEGAEPARRSDAKPIEIKLVETLAASGRVVDDQGDPVTAFEIRAAREGYRSSSGAGDGVRSTVESEDGTFRLAGLSDGSWSITIRADGHQSPDDQRRTISVPADLATDLEFTLPRNATIAGIVVSPSGVPVEGARVARASERGGFGGFGRQQGVETDAEGRFELTGLAQGPQRLEAKSDDWAPCDPTTVDAVAGSATNDVVLTLRMGGTIAGIVRDEQGAPWAGRRVTYATGGGPMAMFAGESTAVTDASGEFVFEHVAAGDWSVTASPGEREMFETMQGATDESAFFKLMSMNMTTEVSVEEGSESYVELGAEARDPVSVIGRVTRAGDAVTDGAVTFAREGADLFANLKRAQIEDDGTYRLELDRPGSYVVSVERGGKRNGFFFDVASGEEQRIDLALPEGGIAGRVRTPEGDAAAGERVTVEPRTSYAFARFDPRSATTEEDGTFEILDLDPGTYTLRVGSRRFGPPGANGGNSAFGRAVVDGIKVTTESVTSGIDVRLTGAGRILGKVENTEGDPVSGATIFVRDASGRSIDSISTVRTNASGEFTYSRVSPGTYIVSARTQDGAAPDEVGVAVVEGKDTDVELRLEGATTLVVTTTDEDEVAVRAEISVKDKDGREMTGLVGTELFRNFGSGISTSEQRVGPLPPGRYTVTATTTDGREKSKRVTVRNKAESRVRLKLKAADDE